MSKELLQKVIDHGIASNLSSFFQNASNHYKELEDNLPDYNGNGFTNFQTIGEINFSAVEKLVVVTANVTGNLTERSGKKAQYETAKKILKAYMHYDAGIFVFGDPQTNNFRFSLVYGQAEGTKKSWSNFRRFTYFVSPELTNKTFRDRIGTCKFASLEQIKDVFSVEKVTKDFYKQIADWYFWAVQNVTFPKDAEKESNGRNISVIRMITRLIFIWFMKERGLVSPQLFSSDRIFKLLKDTSMDGSSYYKAILQNLFFATLNTKIEDREFRFKPSYQGKNKDYMDHGIYRYESYFKNQEDMLEVFKNIPFLNGGLFDCLDRRINEDGKNIEVRIDGFTDKEVGLYVSNLVFFSDEIEADLNEEYGTNNKTYKVQGLLNILSAYNFTIDENDPNDQEVALDPELLGKVFENLLACFDPITATTARKATGSYYTPREIVDYMVTQSLTQYYKTHLQDIADIDNKLNRLFSTASEEQQSPFGATDIARIVKLTDDLRIVDPAVGSGAFPMGILNKLVFILSKLDPENKLWKETQIKAIEGVPDPITRRQLKEQIKVRFTEKNSDYGRKLYLIQNCIYGVDIQQIAVEIAKLRFFIALLVDEKIDKSKYNWGIEPLPNLDFKLMQGNSLVSEFMGINLDVEDSKSYGKLIKDEMDFLIQELRTKKSAYQNEPARDKKKQLLIEIEMLITQIFEEKLKNQKSEYFNKLKAIEQKYSVVSNVQQRNESINKDTTTLNKNYKFDLGLVEKQLREFTSGLKVKPFFAWKLYFAEVFQEKNGFDIVIANPPYGANIDSSIDLFERLYPNTTKAFKDIYKLFIEVGLIKLLTERGFICYITPNTLLRQPRYKDARSFLDRYTILQALDFGLGVFDQVVPTCVFLGQKQHNVASAVLYFDLTMQSHFVGDLRSQKPILIPQKELLDLSYFTIGSTGKKSNNRLLLPLRDVLDLKDAGINYQRVNVGLSEKGKSDLGQRLLYEGEKESSEDVEFWKGEDINKYYQKLETGRFVRIMTTMSLRDNERVILNKQYFSRTPKLIWRQTASWLIVTVDEKGIWFGRSIQGATVKAQFSQLDCFFLAGVLNSSYLRYAYNRRVQEEGRVFPQVKFENLYALPLPIASKTEQQNVISLVKQIIAAKRIDERANISALETQIDKLVYRLYELTPEEIAVVEGTTEK